MAAKPETTFYTSVHKHLPSLSLLHREKMANPYRGGTPDHWYSGAKADLWVEWKFIKTPVRSSTAIRVNLSGLQLDWLKKRTAEGRHAWVIVGSKDGGVIMRAQEWEWEWTTDTFIANLQTRQSLAAAIRDHCL